MEETPQAYSTIFWHFTGAPQFKENSSITKPADMLDSAKIAKHKSNQEAIDILRSILTEQQLVATSTEKIIGDIETKSFCCVCDLPLKDLATHAEYYGNVALGFSARAIYENFNPVLYINQEKLDQEIKTNKNDPKTEAKMEVGEQILGLQLSNHLKVTNFTEDTNQTFYREKEWRCLKDFSFSREDVSAIIVPQTKIAELRDYLKENEYHNVSILSWEIINKS